MNGLHTTLIAKVYFVKVSPGKNLILYFNRPKGEKTSEF